MVMPLLALLSLLQLVSDNEDLSLSINTKSILSLVFVAVRSSKGDNIALIHRKSVMLSDGWLNVTLIRKGEILSFCLPTLWFAMLFNMTLLENEAD